MDVNAAELEMLEAIKADGCLARAFPEDPTKYQFLDPVLVHLLRYEQGIASEPVPNRKEVIVQDTRHEFVVVTLYRHLTGNGGVYQHLELLRKALVGYTLTGIPQATAFFLVKQGFLTEKDGVWYYQSIFAMTCPESE